MAIRELQFHPRVIWLIWIFATIITVSTLGQSRKLHDVLGPDFLLSSKELENLHENAEACSDDGDFSKATQFLNQALKVARESSPPIPRDVSNILTSLAEIYFDQAEFEKAVSLLKESLALGEKSLGLDHPVVARALNVFGFIHGAKGEYDQAASSFERALAIWKKAYGEENAGFVASGHNLGVVYRDQGRYSDALAILEHSLPIAEKVLGNADRTFAQMLNNVSMINKNLGDYRRALPLCRRSLEIREKLFAGNSPEVAESLNNLASIYRAQANYSQALPLMLRAVKILERRYGSDHPEVATMLNNLGHLYDDLGEDENAVALFARALTIRRKHFNHNHPSIADSLDTLASIYAASGNHQKALQLFHECFQIQKKVFGEHHHEVARTLMGVAAVYLEQRRFKEALDCLKVSLDITEKAYGPSHLDVASCLDGLGLVYHELGDDEKSLRMYDRSLDVKSKIFEYSHPSLTDTIEKIGVSLWTQGRTAQALGLLSEGLKANRDYLVTQLVSSSDTIAARTVSRSFLKDELFHSVCASGVAKGLFAANALGAEQLALDKALLEEVRVRQAAVEISSDTKIQEIRQAHEDAQNQLARLPESRVNPAERDQRHQALLLRLADLEAQLAERLEFATVLVRARDLRLTDIAASLALRAVLVDFVQFRRADLSAESNGWKEPRYAAYLTFPLVKDSTNVIVERVDLGEAAPINEAVELICKRMSARQFAAKDVQPALQRVSDLVYAPLAKHLANSSHLIICPDGQLSRLPFEMLRAGNKFLVEEKTISYVTSGREVVRVAANLSNSKRPTQPAKSMVMGNPDFDFDLASARPSVPTAQLASMPPALRSLSGNFRSFKFKPLPGAEAEARDVAKLLGSDTSLRLGAEAREAELKAVHSPRVLHLATHGFFLSDQEFKRTNSPTWNSAFTRPRPAAGSTPNWENPLVRCGIALAGANRAQRITNAIAEDGVLTGLEASLLSLQGTELVILSACESGTGEVKIGEGVMSLRRAFRIAGAETVLASHWIVSDKATSRLMTEFMRRWRAGEPRAKAWREAQLLLLRSKGAKEDFSNPFFWSAFTLTGQWQ